MKITHDDYLKLTGLFTLAARHNRMVDEIGAAAVEILGEEERDFAYDLVYESGRGGRYDPLPDPKERLRRAEIEVEDG